MLGYPGAGCGRHKHDGGRDIKSMGTIAPRADNVEQILGIMHRHRRGELAHDGSCGGDLFNAFFLDAQANKKE